MQYYNYHAELRDYGNHVGVSVSVGVGVELPDCGHRLIDKLG